MKFCCPQCARWEEIIADISPWCRFCPRVKMVPARAKGYTDLLMSPGFAITRFEQLIGKYGYEGVKDGRFKQEREAWISAVWALGLRETMQPIDYWIEIETRDQTPDCKVKFLETSTGNNHVKVLNVEVVEWEEHTSEVLDVIRKKCAKAYPDYFYLLMLARNGKEINPFELLESLQEVRIPFTEMWIIGKLSDNRVDTQYGMFRTHPTNWSVEFNLTRALLNDKREFHMLTAQQRGTGIKFTNLGPEYIPIPGID